MKFNYLRVLFPFLSIVILLSACGSENETASNVNPSGSGYVVFAWNDLGMHCLNPTYDEAVILPPYNNLVAQVVKRGSKPQIVTSGITVEYRIVNNTYSSGKRSYGQFWDYALGLFGVVLQRDKGLNISDPLVSNGLSGLMLAKPDYFVANGIPVTPVDDSGVWNPYQVAEVTVKDASGAVVAQTRTNVPVSDEINCGKCHGQKPFGDILARHDTLHGTSLASRKPVLCAECHGSPVLGQSGPGSSGKYLSYAIHKSHSGRSATCYDCHPGDTTKCNRSLSHTSTDGNCSQCHGSMTQVADSISSGGRTPWLSEPNCLTCHDGVSGVDTGQTLYRNSRGHGNIYCAGCHGSPHAMFPSREASDNYQAIQYQGRAKAIGSCGACHEHSRGEGSNEFLEEHGGTNPENLSACNICHTSVTANTGQWPHSFQWKNR